MKIIPKIAFLTVAAALAVGCCPCRSYQKRTQRPLTGTEWQLVQLGGTKIEPAPETFTIRFNASGNTFTGIGACNRLMTNFETAADRSLRIGSIASSRMSCPDLPLEMKFIEALEKTTHYDMDGPMLLLLSDGELQAVLQALPAETGK